MKTYKIIFLLLGTAAFLSVAGCESSKKELLKTDQSQLESRSIQTREYDVTDKDRTLRTVIATLQDLGFVIDKADEVLGSVSATKLDGYQLRMTVTVRPKGKDQLLVRATAQYKLKSVDDPQVYQDFFTSLDKSMFLSTHQVEY
jgi:hypothetical protein